MLKPFPLSRRTFISGFLVASAGLSLGACSSPPSPTFDLSAAKDTSARRRGGLRGQLIVYEPGALAVYDSDRIVVKGASQGLTYLPGAQWADRLPRLVQTRMIQSIENVNHYKSVGRPGDQISGTMVLNSEIRAFQIDEQTRQATIELSAKLIVPGSGQIRKAQLFRAATPVTAIDAAGATAALDASLTSVLSQLVSWASV